MRCFCTYVLFIDVHLCSSAEIPASVILQFEGIGIRTYYNLNILIDTFV